MSAGWERGWECGWAPICPQVPYSQTNSSGYETMILERLVDHTVLVSAIAPGATVIDAGFNKGEFSSALLARVDCRIVALEPLPQLVLSASPHRHVELMQKALASATGPRRLHEFHGHCASLHVLGDGELKAETVVDAISLRDILFQKRIDRVALLKLDIEGEEVDLLLQLESEILSRIDQITVEFHFVNFPDHRKKFEAIAQRMSAAGFWYHNFSTKPGTDILFVRKHLVQSMASRFRLIWTGYRLGLQRIINRKISRNHPNDVATHSVGR